MPGNILCREASYILRAAALVSSSTTTVFMSTAALSILIAGEHE